jgi:hypothetical protein
MSGAVFVLTPDLNGAIGGIKVHYQMVDALNAVGRRAFVVHGTPGFRCTWFANQTEVVAAESAQLRANDVVVVPEEWVEHIPKMPSEIDKVIFNQNAYTTFLWGQPWPSIRDIYRRADVRRVVVVSEDNHDYMRYVFPAVDSVVVRHAIDPAMFHMGDPKTRSIAYMPRKRRDEATEVLAILGARGALDGWEVTPIVDRSETQTAEILSRTSVFLSFSHREGFGLPPAEALACGCVVAGYHGYGGRDISPHALWVADGDVLGFARTVEDILTSWDREAQRWALLRDEGARHARATYTPQRFGETVAAAFDGVGSAADQRLVGPLPSECWSAAGLWPRVVGRLRMAARVAVSGSP